MFESSLLGRPAIVEDDNPIRAGMTLTRGSGERARDQAALRVLVRPVSGLGSITPAATVEESDPG
jgi:hypothetical protein